METANTWYLGCGSNRVKVLHSSEITASELLQWDEVVTLENFDAEHSEERLHAEFLTGRGYVEVISPALVSDENFEKLLEIVKLRSNHKEFRFVSCYKAR